VTEMRKMIAVAAEILLYFGLVNATISVGIGSIAGFRFLEQEVYKSNKVEE